MLLGILLRRQGKFNLLRILLLSSALLLAGGTVMLIAG